MTDEDESRICQKCGSGRMRLTRRVRTNETENITRTREYLCDNPECKAKLVKAETTEKVPISDRVEKDILSGSLLINCSGRACRTVLDKVEDMKGVTFAFQVDKKSKQEPDLIVNVSGNKFEIEQAGNAIRQIHGVSSVKHEVGTSLLY
jgi:hypothetical protein